MAWASGWGSAWTGLEVECVEAFLWHGGSSGWELRKAVRVVMNVCWCI